MDRRQALGALAALAVAPRIFAAARTRHVTSLQPIGSCAQTEQAIIPELRRALRQLGLDDIVFANHCFGNDFARAKTIAREAIRNGTGLLVVGGTSTARAMLQVTRSVPIIAIVGDPVATGFTRDLNRPEGNVTGFSNSRPETPAKVVELALSIAPSLSRLVIVGDAEYPDAAALMKPLERAAAAAKIRSATRLAKAPEMEALFASLKKGDLAYVEHALADPAAIAAAALRHHVPVMMNDRTFIGHGGLVGYNVRTGNISLRQAAMMDKLLRGARVSDVPWELPDEIYLGVNVKTAQALGLAVPADIRLRATQVVE